MFAMLFVVMIVLVAADNGVFDDTNYNGYDIYNATDISVVGDIVVNSGQKVCYVSDCSHYTYFNGTHVVTV